MILMLDAALAETEPTFKLDKQNSIHFRARTFIRQFLIQPIDWEGKKLNSSGQAGVSSLARGGVDGITTNWTHLVQIAFDRLNGGLFVHIGFIKRFSELTQDVVNAVVKAADSVVQNNKRLVERAMKVPEKSEPMTNLAVGNCAPSVDIPMGTMHRVSKALFELGFQNR